MVANFVYQLGFVDKSLHFGMLDFVEVFVCNVLVYMVQKYLVENNHHHRMLSLCNRAIVVYFYFVEKKSSFRYDPVEFTEFVDVFGRFQFLEYIRFCIFLRGG